MFFLWSFPRSPRVTTVAHPRAAGVTISTDCSILFSAWGRIRPAVSSIKTSQSWLVTMKTPSPAYRGLNRRSFSFCDSFPRLISQHPYYLFLSHLVFSSEKLFQFYKPGLPSFSCYEALEREMDESPLFFNYFSKWGPLSHSYLLLASIAPFLLQHLRFLWCFLFPQWGACLFLFIFNKQSLILDFLVNIPQPSSLRSKVLIQKVNEKFSLYPWGLKRG